MSGERDFEPVSTQPEQPQRDEHAVPRVQEIDSYPLCLSAHHMAALFGKSLKRFYALDAEGAFSFAENKPRIGRKSWSRERVRQYFAGELRGLTVVRKRRA